MGRNAEIDLTEIPSDQLLKGHVLQATSLEIGQPVNDRLGQARSVLNKEEDIVACRNYNGLRLDICRLLAFQHFETIDEVVQYAIKVEERATHQACKVLSLKGIDQSSLLPHTSN
ncbi:hypothetical protein AAC387_Pa05g1454 [Persea americana]